MKKANQNKLQEIELEITKLYRKKRELIDFEIKNTMIPNLKKIVGRCALCEDLNDEDEKTYIKILKLILGDYNKIYLLCEGINITSDNEKTYYRKKIEIYTNDVWVKKRVPILGFKKFIPDKKYNSIKNKLFNK